MFIYDFGKYILLKKLIDRCIGCRIGIFCFIGRLFLFVYIEGF